MLIKGCRVRNLDNIDREAAAQYARESGRTLPGQKGFGSFGAFTAQQQRQFCLLRQRQFQMARQQQLAKTANIAPEASLIDVNRSRFPDGAERLRVSDPSADNLMVLV